jgi:DNA modification methylase
MKIDLFDDLTSKVTADPAITSVGINPNPTEEFPSFGSMAHGELLSVALSANTTKLTHGLHRFPAKYIPQVPRWALREFTSYNSVVLDPFMGSGTTLVEGVCRVEKVLGLDVDPLARMISEAKTAVYSPGRLMTLADEIMSSFGQEEADLFLPMAGVENTEHWFTIQAWASLCAIYKRILSLDCLDSERNFFLCVFSSILRWVSNADDQSQKTFVSGTLHKNPPPAWNTFRKAMGRAIKGVDELSALRLGGDIHILNGSAIEIPVEDETVDLIVTSPPYLDSVDYMYNFMLEYFWLGPRLGVHTRTDFNRWRRTPVGAKNPIRKNDILPSSIENLIDMDNVPEYRRSAVISYFDSMSKHFDEAARILKPGGRYILVVGNSQAQAGVIPVHNSLVKLANNSGLYLEKAFAYRIRRHYMKFPRKGRGGIILLDWVIIMRKSYAPILQEDRLPIPNITLGDSEVAN